MEYSIVNIQSNADKKPIPVSENSKYLIIVCSLMLAIAHVQGLHTSTWTEAAPFTRIKCGAHLSSGIILPHYCEILLLSLSLSLSLYFFAGY
jgi:hypothetical protein